MTRLPSPAGTCRTIRSEVGCMNDLVERDGDLRSTRTLVGLAVELRPAICPRPVVQAGRSRFSAGMQPRSSRAVSTAGEAVHPGAVAGPRHHLAVDVADDAAADPVHSALGPDPVRDDDENPVHRRTRLGLRHLGRALAAGPWGRRPVRRRHDDLCSAAARRRAPSPGTPGRSRSSRRAVPAPGRPPRAGSPPAVKTPSRAPEVGLAVDARDLAAIDDDRALRPLAVGAFAEARPTTAVPGGELPDSVTVGPSTASARTAPPRDVAEDVAARGELGQRR